MADRRPSLPRKIWVGGYEFLLKLTGADDPIFEQDNPDEHTDGITHFEPDKRGVYIASHLGARRTLVVLWHEITHAVNWVAEIDEGTAAITEEGIAEKHGEIWTQLWLDNPRLQRWFTSTTNAIRLERSAA